MKYKWLILILVFILNLGTLQGARAQDCTGISLASNSAQSEEVKNVGDEVMVLLTENIDTSGLSMPCGRVIECVRNEISKIDPKPTPADARRLEIYTMKTKYSQCIVSGRDGLDLLNNYATLVYRWIAGIVGSLCILIIIVSGIQISIGGLSQDEVGSAKERISRSLIGLVVLFLSAFILYTINPTFFT